MTGLTANIVLLSCYFISVIFVCKSTAFLGNKRKAVDLETKEHQLICNTLIYKNRADTKVQYCIQNCGKLIKTKHEGLCTSTCMHV
jgi:hypothetical protein